MSTTATLGTAFDKALTEEQGKQSATADQAPDPTKEAEAAATATPPAEEKGAEPAQPPEGSDELLDQETYDKLKSNPEELRKALNAAFTQKTQKLSEQRTRLEPYLDLIEALEKNPQEAIRELQKHYGIGEENKAQATEQVVDRVSDALLKTFGPDSPELVSAISTAIREAASEATKTLIAKEVEPLKQQALEEREKAVTQDVNANLEVFTKKHPDWKQYEPKIVELSAKFQPVADANGQYPTWEEYMETLYIVASAGAKKADIVRETIKRIDQSAKKAESPDSGVAASHVAKAAPKFVNINEAVQQCFDDAKQGIVYEK